MQKRKNFYLRKTKSEDIFMHDFLPFVQLGHLC